MSGEQPGEFDLIARLVEAVDAASPGGVQAGAVDRVVLGTGDDAAVTDPQGVTATSVDAFVEGVHFRRETAPLASIGRKAMTAALSDLAAMGAAPGEAYVQLGIPPGFDEAQSVELATGLGRAAAENGVAIVGGDLTRAPVLLLAMTVVGHATAAGELVSRAGAQPGDLVTVTGELGGAAAGLLLLQRPELAEAVGADLAASLRGRQLEPAPRIAAGRALAAGGATAMIDLSDGLGGDSRHVARASGVGLVVELDSLPVQHGVGDVAGAAGVDRWDLVTAGGEDYELLATLPPRCLADARAAVGDAGTTLTPIGEVTDGDDVSLRQPDGSLREASGFDQLRR